MNILKFLKEYFIAVICLLIFAGITIFRIINHIPFFDEAHAWLMTEQLNYWDLINEVKNEGHMFIWQTLMYPFAKTQILPYPYPMQILNWSFCFLAMILMWWKAPFDNITKTLITFSFPFLGCYGVLARCYSIGILLLFILASLFHNKLKYPKTYALLLIICANTNVMCLIGASAFGFLFLYDLIKYRNSLKSKDIFIVSSILAVGVSIVLLQLLQIGYLEPISSNRRPHVSIKVFRNTFVYHNLLANLVLISIFSVPIIKYFMEHRYLCFFISYTYGVLLLFVTCVYGGNFWHSYFFFIYLIIGFWICKGQNSYILVKKFAYVSLCVISLILIFHKPVWKDYKDAFGPLRTKDLISIIENDDKLSKAQIIQNDGVLYETIPYSTGKAYKLRSHCSPLKNRDYGLLYNDDKLCAVKRTVEQAKRYPGIIKSILETNDYNDTYTYIDAVDYATVKTYYLIPAEGYSIYFTKYKCYDRYCFWKVELTK